MYWKAKFYQKLIITLSYLFPQIVFRECKTNAEVHLTFDDGPHPIYTPQILEILNKFNAKATFFINGNKAQQYPHLVSQIAETGHQIGIHSYQHLKLVFKSSEFIRQQISETQKTIEKITHAKSQLFRPPYGIFSPAVLNICSELKLKFVMWDIITYDYNLRMPNENIIKTITNQVKNGSIILLHDGHINSHRTVDILPDIIKIISEKGKILTTV